VKERGRARHAADKALNRLIEGADVIGAMIDYEHYSREAALQSKQMRMLRTEAEILSMPSDKQIIHADGLPHPIEADRKPYYEQRFMAGRFYPNPYYPPLDKVRVKTRFGHTWLRVIHEPHADGMRSRIEKRKWWQ
jgi:type IV secretion system protein VirD4